MDAERMAAEAELAEIVEIGEGFLDCSLPGERFDHRAHLIMTTYLLTHYPERNWERDLPEHIKRFNVAHGGVNDHTRGYHHTITLAFLRAVSSIVWSTQVQDPVVACRRVLASDLRERDYLLRFWSRSLLFSREARATWVAPDLRPAAWEARWTPSPSAPDRPRVRVKDGTPPSASTS